jgi:hypothetical protein
MIEVRRTGESDPIQLKVVVRVEAIFSGRTSSQTGSPQVSGQSGRITMGSRCRTGVAVGLLEIVEWVEHQGDDQRGRWGGATNSQPHVADWSNRG